MLSNKVEKQKMNSLQTVRALAFLGIFTSHCGMGDFGAWGVSVFIVLSGFLMTYSYYERDIDCTLYGSIRFSIKKISKLYLLHICMTIAALILTIISIKDNISFFVIGKQCVMFVINILLIQDWFPNSKIYFSMNGVAWYLSLCLFLYFIFPFILNGIKKLKSIKMAFFMMVVIYLLQCIMGFCLIYVNLNNAYIDAFSKWVIYIFPIFRLGDFAIGCCMGYIFLKKNKTLSTILASIGEAFVIIAILGVQYIYMNKVGFLGSENFRYNMLYTWTSVVLIYLLAINKGIISKLLTCKIIVYIGNISAYAFLIHQIVIRYMDVVINHMFIKEEMNLCIRLMLAFLLTILCSEFYKLCESCIRKRDKITK